MPTMKPLLKKPVFILILCSLALTAVLGWQAAEWRYISAEAEMRERLLRQAMDAARDINTELIKQLTFTIADVGAPAFESIRERLALHSRDMREGGIYSLALRDSILVIGPQSYSGGGLMAGLPGTVQENPGREVLEVFTQRRPYITGPRAGEYGVFISALAPILDPYSGEVLMLVGIDIPVSAWQSRLGAALLFPLLTALTLILMVLAGAYCLYRRNKRRQPETLRLRSWILGPVAIALLGGVGFWTGHLYLETSGEMDRDMERLRDQSSRRWNHMLACQDLVVKAQMDHIARDRSWADAWRNRDLDRLSGLAAPIAEELRRKYRIDRLSFLAPDRICLLRLHDPEKSGDRPGDHSLLNAARTGEDAGGIEFDPNGTFILRYVRPWLQDGELLGYLEMEMGLEHLLHNLALDLNVDLFALVRKDLSSRKEPAASHQDVFGPFVTAYRTIPEVPAKLADWLAHDPESPQAEKMLHVRQDGRLLCATMVPQFDAADRGMAALVVMRDITADLTRSRSALIFNLCLVLFLAAGLLALLWSISDTAERQLAARAEDAQISRTDLEQFAIAVSHDLRQPLRMIGNYLQILEKELHAQLNENSRRYFNYAIDGAKRMDGIVLSMLAYAVVGRRGTPREPLESREVLAEALEHLDPAIQDAGAEIRVHGDWPRIRGHRDEMVRLFQNLIGNAVKFRGEGEMPIVEITAARSGSDIMFSVRDNGIGIDQADLPRLFQLFSRLHSQARYPGAGIGLALCRKIVEHHGGRIWAESPGEGRGSVFHLTVPGP